MVLTSSKMIDLGTQAPDFSLPDTISGKKMSLNDLKSNIATVIMFICNHCPYVKHIRKELIKMAGEYLPKGIQFVAISSNDAKEYPADGPEEMKDVAKQYNYPFPYLYDESQKVAKDYDATCTPDLFVFDNNLKCVYRGRFDESTPGNNIPVTGNDLRAALNNILEGKPVASDQKPSMGCNIKWK